MRSPGSSTWAVIAGGGTGGHVVPAIAIGQALVARGHPASTIHYVGSRRGIERRMVPEAGFEVTLMPGRGIARRLTLDNVGAVAGLVVALWQSLRLLARLRPRIVVAVGGYASAACAIAAVVLRIPLVVAEQNAVPGLANRIAGRFAAASAVSFERTDLPRAVVTGNPVRPAVTSVDRSGAGRSSAVAALELPADRMVVAIAGGSLGARRINQAVLELVSLWRDRSDVAIRHVVGERDFAWMQSTMPDGGSLVYQQVVFEDRMDLLLAAADVAVQRAGASTVSELEAAGVPSILIPLPGAPGDHQTANAKRLAEAGAAVLVPDGELNGARLAKELDGLLGDPERREDMGAAARRLSRPDAAAAVAALVEAHARG